MLGPGSCDHLQGKEAESVSGKLQNLAQRMGVQTGGLASQVRSREVPMGLGPRGLWAATRGQLGTVIQAG